MMLTMEFRHVLELRKQQKAKGSFRELLDSIIGDYNSTLQNVNWRVRNEQKKMLWNTMRLPQSSERLLISHYSEYKSTESALSVNALGLDCLLPGSKLLPQSATLDPEENTIMTMTEEGLNIWLGRAIGDFKRNAPPKSSGKVKARLPTTPCCFVLKLND